MKIKAVLAVLFLFVLGAGLSEASTGTSFFHDHMAYELGHLSFAEQGRPAYMPPEFGVRAARQAVIIPAQQPAQVVATPAPQAEVADDFVPFDYARVRFAGNVPSAQNEAETADGFMSFEDVRARLADSAPPAQNVQPAQIVYYSPSLNETETAGDFVSFDYARARFAGNVPPAQDAQPVQVVHTSPSLTEAQTADSFVSFEYARARFAESAPPHQAPATPTILPVIAGDDGFIPFEYARARFAN